MYGLKVSGLKNRAKQKRESRTLANYYNAFIKSLEGDLLSRDSA